MQIRVHRFDSGTRLQQNQALIRFLFTISSYTIDGTGVRDYIHVVDLAQAHVAAVKQLETLDAFEVINIVTGKGLSVLQMVKEFEKQSGKSVCYQIGPRRPGDAPAVWAEASKAIDKIGFKASRGIAEMCQDTWHWQDANQTGFAKNRTAST